MQGVLVNPVKEIDGYSRVLQKTLIPSLMSLNLLTRSYIFLVFVNRQQNFHQGLVVLIARGEDT